MRSPGNPSDLDHELQIAQHTLRINAAGGIVGRVENQRARARCDRRGDALHIGQEGSIGLDGDHAAAMVGDIKRVLGEAGHQDDDFVAGIEDRFEDHVACARGTDRHKNILGGERKASLSLEFSSDGLADPRIAGIGHIAMRAGTVGGHNAPQRIHHRGRRFHVGVAKRIIEDRIGPALALQPHAFLEHAANPGGVLELLGNRL